MSCMQQTLTNTFNQEEVRHMKEITSTISSKGQVTVPVEVRKRLGLKQGEKISFVIEDEGEAGEVGGVRLQAPKYRDVSALRGAAGSLKEPLTWTEMRQIAREEHVRQIMGVTDTTDITDITASTGSTSDK